ncbi:MAG TPA: aromatic-ring-hydroxylating dioxygenase subunit beta [Stellaceae bacterium]|nr:aromatic-ring-hydroxylating dioxygenase subunit beta [Stellaceae bacterium]
MALAADIDIRQIEAFLYREAMLLDEKRWQEWLALYTEDCFYWVPSVIGQKDPVNTVSLYAEDRMRMEMRIIRITHPRAFSQDFPTRMSHVVGNIMRDPDGGAGADGGVEPKADLVVRSSVHILEFRKDEQRLFGGTVRHWLRRSASDWKIAMKRIDLLNCDAPMEVVQLFL